MTLMIPDAQLDALADEFIRLNLPRAGVNLEQFIRSPQSYREHYDLRTQHDLAERRQPKATTGRVDEPLKHTRYKRQRGKSDFTRRANV
jgi:hypothetical protein